MKWLPRIGLSLASLAISLLVVEGALRLLGVSYPSFYQADPELGNALRPGAEGWFREEGEAFVRINAAGMRDRERPLAKPPGTYRIAILGDSFALAKQVDVEAAFPRQLEGRLASCPALEGRRVDVLNFGVSAYGTGQELLMLRRRVWPFEPDLVLLAFLTGNDLLDSSLELSPQLLLRPFFRVVDGVPVPDFSFRQTKNYRTRTSLAWRTAQAVIDHCRLLQLANHVKNARLASNLARLRGADTPEARARIGLDPAVYRAPTSGPWQRAWRLSELLVRTMAREVRDGGSRFALVVLSNAIQSHPDPEVRRRYQQVEGVQDLFYPDDRLLRLARVSGFPALSLARDFQRHAQSTGTYLHGFPNTILGEGHWNEAGHALAGELMAPFVCNLVAGHDATAAQPGSPSSPSSSR